MPRLLRPQASARTAALRALTLAGLALTLPACAGFGPRIAPYDAETEGAVTALHRRVETVLTTLERAEGGEGAFAGFAPLYDTLHVDLRALRLRASARPLNGLQAQQLDGLQEQLGLLEEAHREGIAPAEVPAFRMGFDQSFRAILTLELAKKRGP